MVSSGQLEGAFMQNSKPIKSTFFPDRPYEKAETLGFEALSDRELLAIILRSGTSGVNALDLAEEILSYQDGNISNIRRMSLNEFKNLRGIGGVKAIQIKACAEIALRMIQEERRKSLSFFNSYSVAMYFMELLRYETCEKVIVAFFNNAKDLIGQITVSIGSKEMTTIDVPRIFKEAINYNASDFILIHNHPSGDPKPSAEDYNVTMRLKECGELLNLPLRDHIVIGDNVYYSFFEHGVLKA